MQIQISWLLQKPTDLDLHCLLRQGMSCSAREGLNLSGDYGGVRVCCVCRGSTHVLISSASSVLSTFPLVSISLFLTTSCVTFLPFCQLGCKMTDEGWCVVNPCLADPDIPCLCKQCRSRSVGFWRSQLIWICTVCHPVCEFISTTWIM